MENVQKRSFFPSRPLRDDLPISQQAGMGAGEPQKIGLRRRFSSFSIRPLSSAAAASSAWAFRRSKSMSSIGGMAGGSLRRWWEWGWGWVLSRKPTFARDLEMNEEETTLLGFNSKGSWRHILYKLRSEFRKMVAGPAQELPTSQSQPFRCDSFSYSQPRHEANVSVY